MNSKRHVMTKDDANKALDNINAWINNCDTKASITLGFYVAIITICLSKDFLDIQAEILDNVCQNFKFGTGIYIVLYCLALIGFILGIIELLKVIIPRITLKTDSQEKNFNSVLFFSSIAQNTPRYEDYCKAVFKITNEEEILEDLLFQVHSAAVICHKKFEYFKKGLIISAISLLNFFILNVIGVYLI